MNKTLVMAMALLGATPCAAQKVNIGKSNIQLKSDLMTPEALWAMGRIGSPKASPDGRSIVYQVGYYSVAENRGHQVICVTSADGKQNRQLTTSADNETDRMVARRQENLLSHQQPALEHGSRRL